MNIPQRTPEQQSLFVRISMMSRAMGLTLTCERDPETGAELEYVAEDMEYRRVNNGDIGYQIRRETLDDIAEAIEKDFWEMCDNRDIGIDYMRGFYTCWGWDFPDRPGAQSIYVSQVCFTV